MPVASLAVIVALAVGLSACGSSSSSSSSTAAASASSATAQQARLNLAKCFRAHGLNVPDPSSNGGAAAGGSLFRTLRNYSQAQVTAARKACQQYFAQAFPRANVSPQQRAQLQQQLVKFAQCMRSHGVNVPDPTFNNNGTPGGGGGGGGGGGFGFGGGFRSGERNSPAFQTALKACQSLRPQFGRGGPGGGGAAGSGAGTSTGGSNSD